MCVTIFAGSRLDYEARYAAPRELPKDFGHTSKSEHDRRRTAMTVQEPDVVAFVTALDEAVNAGRLEAALALFSDDAVATFPSQPEPNRFAGKEQIRNWLQSDISEGIHVESSERQADGERVVWTGRISLAAWRERGIAPIEGKGEAIIRDDRIVSFTYAVLPESLARMQQASLL
jgi:ketosteroid isomerase-like protein